MKVMLIQTLYLNFLIFLLNSMHQYVAIVVSFFYYLAAIFFTSASSNMHLCNDVNAGANIIKTR